MKKKIRVRFAPSPTGALHIGGLRTAFFNYLFAIQNQGDFILRIEDTDIRKNTKYSIEYILKALKWCKIKVNEGYNHRGEFGPYIQSKRIKIYKKYLKILKKKKLIYYSFESKDELKKYKINNKNFIYNSLTRYKLKNSLSKNNNKKTINYYLKNKKYVIRIKTPKNKDIIIKDKIYGNIKINTNNIDDKILFRSNDTPTYHFASVIDDYLMNITHIIRGKEWIYSSPIHILIYNNFKWKLPKFIHLPLLLNNKGGKISKSKMVKNKIPIHPINYNKLNINNSYKSNGFLPNAFINILALLGWTPKNNKEIYSFKEIIKLFNFKNINKSDVHLNYNKFRWINKKYLNKISNKYYYKYLKKKIKSNIFNLYTKKKINKIINLTKNRISLINEIWDVSSYFFLNPKTYFIPTNIISYIKDNKKKIILLLNKFIIILKKNKKKTDINYNDIIKKLSIFNLKLLRISIVGKLIGIDMYNILSLIKTKIIIKRIINFKNFIISQYKI
ncbi:MAG: glutamate--tRNA ligase [Candidatus Shikimatogenerans bostrichidophilus]|nr:MAG: glutamate--tRNA ligase [Candidatus Shikimatogenerans bostrichidophilus]